MHCIALLIVLDSLNVHVSIFKSNEIRPRPIFGGLCCTVDVKINSVVHHWKVLVITISRKMKITP